VIAVEAVAGWLLKSVEIRCFHSYKIAYIAGANKGSACLSAIFLPEVAFHRRSRTAVICLHRRIAGWSTPVLAITICEKIIPKPSAQPFTIG